MTWICKLGLPKKSISQSWWMQNPALFFKKMMFRFSITVFLDAHVSIGDFHGFPRPRLVGGMIGFDHPQIFTKHCLIGFLRSKARPARPEPRKYKHNYTIIIHALCTECIRDMCIYIFHITLRCHISLDVS